MANKDISEVNISHWGKATRSYHLVIRIAKIKNTDNTKCGGTYGPTRTPLCMLMV